MSVAGASKLIFKYITDAGEFVYDNVEAGMELKTPNKISGAVNNPETDSDDTELITNREGVITTSLSKVNPKGAYSKSHQSAKYTVKKGASPVHDGKAPRSIVNNWSLIKYRGGPLTGDAEPLPGDVNKPQVWKGGDLPTNPTHKTIIEVLNGVSTSPGYQYKLADFLFCSYYGKVPNNHMLTLRRFAYPVEDNIISPKKFDANGKEVATHQPALATAVTYISPHIGNELKNILKFGVGFNWEDVPAKLQEISSQPRDKGFVGGFVDALPLSANVQGGMAGESAATTHRRQKHGAGWDPIKQTYPNHSLSPLDIIDKIKMRKAGLTFDQSFELKFDYSLKGIPGTSPKVAFLDVLANMLVLTYNNAPFWGGAIRYTGGGKVGRPLGDLKKLQNGDYKGFFAGIIQQLSSTVSKGWEDIKKGTDSKILKNVGGGALMELLGGPQGGQIAEAFLAGSATGQWHLTVGNPLNPMAVIGNLALEKANFEFHGPLGYEDFPTKLTVTISLTPGRPRDKADIESMFNAGKGRLYIAEEGVLDSSKTFDVDAYGKAYDKENNAARKAARFTNG